MDARKVLTAGSDAMFKANKVNLTLETLMTNLMLMKMPENIRDKMVTELNQTCPGFNMSLPQFTKAFTDATNSVPDNEQVVPVGFYNTQSTLVPVKGDVKICIAHFPQRHEENDCVLKTPAEVRKHLIKNGRCVGCTKSQYWHLKEGVVKPCYMSSKDVCDHGKYYRTCEGPNYVHPECQFVLRQTNTRT